MYLFILLLCNEQRKNFIMQRNKLLTVIMIINYHKLIMIMKAESWVLLQEAAHLLLQGAAPPSCSC